MQDHIPAQPENSFRIVLKTNSAQKRLDNVLLLALREQSENIDFKNISRSDFKELFNSKKILIKGQNAKPASAVAKGDTYVDILL